MKTSCTLFTALLVLAFTQITNAQTYVNAAATGNNDGTSWADAYTELATALDNYSAGDEIWVAAGTYLPGQPSAWPGDPKNTFYLYQNVAIYGGFNGTETMLSERDPAANVTVLSGDLDGDDVVDDFENNREDNANNLVYIDTTASATIDGFTISGGHADGDTTQYYNRRGAAIFSWGVVELNNCIVEQNFTMGLAAVFMQGEAAEGSKIENSIFKKNKAVSAGAILALFLNGEGLSITGCQFVENEFEGVAGAIGLEAAASISDCQFSNNSGGIGGGAIYIQSWTFSDFEVTVTDCDFEGNSAVTGGAFYYLSVENGSNKLSFNGCEFTGNTAISAQAGDFPDGGAIVFEFSDGNPTNDSIIIADCLFENNTAELRGGGITYFNGTGTDNFLDISNSTFSENASVTFGGGIYFHNYGADQMEVNLTGNEFKNNSSTDGGGVVFFTTNGEYNDFNVTSCDFTGNQATDMNTGETPDGGGIYVNFQAPGDTLQFNTVTVEDCTLQGNSAEQRGGGILVFDNIGNDNSVAINNCQISGNTSGEGGGGLFLANIGGSNFGVNVSGSDFTDNSSNHGGAFYYWSNDGDNNNLLFSGCNFTGNTAITSPNFQFPDGGALGFQYTSGNPTNDTISLDNCVLENNTAERYGGGIAFFNNYGTDNHMEISNCEIAGNAAGTISEGGGMAMTEGATTSSVLIRNTHFSANTAEEVQGFYVLNFPGDEPSESSHVELLNCLFTDHNPNPGSSALVLTVTAAQNAKYIMTNCTIVDNDCSATALYASEKDTKLTLQNTILQSGSFSDLFLVPGPANSEVQSLGGNLVGSGALDAFLNNNDQSGADPLFEAGTYQLSQNSPAVDAGTLPDNPPATDLADNDRIQGGCIDIGAYESPYDAGTSCLTDTWEVLAAPSTILIYPNPVVATASISIENEWNGELNLRIVNALGQVVHTTTFEQYSKETVVEFDTGNLPKGLYRVMVSDGQLIAVGSFVRL